MIETTQEVSLSGYPAVLGSSDPGKITQRPQVNFITVDGGVRLEQTTCDEPTMTSISVAPCSTQLMAVFIEVEGGYVTWTDWIPHFLSGTVRASGTVVPDKYDVWIRINEQHAGAVQDREHQHVEDYVRAFDLSCRALLEAVNSLASQVFDGEQEALRELAASVAPHLAPDDMTDLAAWTTRAVRAYDALAGLSNRRDGYSRDVGRAPDYPHKPSWWAVAEPSTEAGEPPKLFFEPIMRERQIRSEDLINFDDAITAYEWNLQASTVSRPAPEPAFEKNQSIRFIEEYTFEGNVIPVGTTGTYEGADGDPGLPHWLSVHLPSGWIIDFFPHDVIRCLEAAPESVVMTDTAPSGEETDADDASNGSSTSPQAMEDDFTEVLRILSGLSGE
jgi:hypothetical protein